MLKSFPLLIIVVTGFAIVQRSQANDRFGLLVQPNGFASFLNPDGESYFALGVNHIGNTEAKPGDAVDQLKQWGFNCAGGDNSGPIQDELPYFVTVSLTDTAHWMRQDRFRYEDIFDPEYATKIDLLVAETCERHRGNPNLIGYYWTDTPRWELDLVRLRRGVDWVSFIRSLPAEAAGKRAYVEFLRGRFDRSIDKLNVAFRSDINSFDELLTDSLSGLELLRPTVRESDEEFLGLIAERIYSVAASAFERHDPGRLILGEKYKSHDHPSRVLKAALPYVDVISIQDGPEFGPFPGQGKHERTFDRSYFDQLHKQTGKPILICDHAVSWKTPGRSKTLWYQYDSEAEAARSYHAYLTSAARTPYIVGYCRCQYVSQYREDRGLLKQGLLDERAEPYRIFVAGVAKTNREALKIRADIADSGPRFSGLREVNAIAAPTSPNPIAITNIRLVDGTGAPAIEDGCVIVRGDTIEYAGQRSKMRLPDDAERFDGGGKTLLPGLFDSHFHSRDSAERPIEYELANGITSFREPGHPFKYYAWLEGNTKVVPRIFMCGGHLDAAPPAWPDQAVVITREDQIPKAIEAHVDRGASAIKIYMRLPREHIKIVCDVADQHGIPVTAHLELVDATDAIAAGIDGVEHITSFGTSLADAEQATIFKDVVRANSRARKEWRPRLWSTIRFSENPRVEEVLRAVVNHDVFISPTLAIYEARAGKKDATPVQVEGFANMLQFFELCHQRGAKIVVGSHTAAPFADRGKAYLREVQLMAESGMTPLEIIRAATMNNSEFFGVSERLGTLETGKTADLILVDGKPDHQIDDLGRVTDVMLGGNWVDLDTN